MIIVGVLAVAPTRQKFVVIVVALAQQIYGKLYLFSWTDNVRGARVNMDWKIWCTSASAYRYYALNHL